MALSILDGNQSATTLSTILSSGQHITAHTVVSLGTQAITDMRSAVSGSVVSIPFLPAISGTVTASIEVPYIKANINVVDADTNPIVSNVFLRKIGEYTYESIRYQGGEDEAYLRIYLDAGNESTQKIWRLYSYGAYAGVQGLIASILPQNAGSSNGDPIPPKTGWTLGAGITGTLSVSYEQPSTQPIFGTVTANSSNGSLTTRFGSVTTANTAFATSAVTNANRKYLLIQNVTTASNAITVGIGFTPTTTQGILLSSGAGITFEGNYIPTGAVNLLSSVTASCFTILEA
jgi:hypothetical protein